MEKPDLSHMTSDELIQLVMACRFSGDESDQQFANFCREEIKRRKPVAAPSTGRKT